MKLKEEYASIKHVGILLNNMKIALDCRFIGKSGIGTYIENIVDELCNNHPEHNYLLIAELGKVLNYNNDNVSILYTDIQPFSLREIFAFPTREINQCDAYFTPYINIPGGIIIPTYSTIHDVIFLDLPSLTSGMGKMIRKWFIHRAINKSKSIFTVSEFSKRRIKFYFNTNKNVVVTFSAISKSLKQYSKYLFSRYSKGTYLIYVGNIKAHKGLKVLLEAFTKAIAEGYDKELYIVGDAEKMRTSDSKINHFIENNNRIKFTGFVPNKKMYNLICGADALILPTFYEGFGLTPLEALYLGTDVIISDIEVLKEVYSKLPVTFFRTGDIDDLAEKIIKNHNNIEEVDKLRNRIDGLYNFKDIAVKILKEIEI